MAFWMMFLASLGCESNQSPSLSVITRCTKVFRFGIAELGLGLAFELRGGEFHRHHCGQAFAHVVAGEVLILVFEDVLFTCVTVDERGQRGAEAFFVGTAFGGGDGVGEGVHRFGVCGGPLHGDFRGNADFQVFRFEIDHVPGSTGVALRDFTK